jgi:hypothetical protein
MPQRHHKPEETAAKLMQVDVLLPLGRPIAKRQPPSVVAWRASVRP